MPSKKTEEKKKDKNTKDTDKIQKNQATEGLGLNLYNYLIIAAGIVSVLLGYIFLRQGSITLAPILLIAGYVVLIPLGLIISIQKKKQVKTAEKGESR